MESKIVFFAAHLGLRIMMSIYGLMGWSFSLRNGPGSNVWVDHVVEAKIWHFFMAEKKGPSKKDIRYCVDSYSELCGCFIEIHFDWNKFGKP